MPVINPLVNRTSGAIAPEFLWHLIPSWSLHQYPPFSVAHPGFSIMMAWSVLGASEVRSVNTREKSRPVPRSWTRGFTWSWQNHAILRIWIRIILCKFYGIFLLLVSRASCVSNVTSAYKKKWTSSPHCPRLRTPQKLHTWEGNF